MDYKNKYIKYKQKYLNLKDMIKQKYLNLKGGKMIQLFIKDEGSQTKTIDIDENSLVSDIQTIYQVKFGIKQELLIRYLGRILDKTKNLSFYKIENLSTIYISRIIKIEMNPRANELFSNVIQKLITDYNENTQIILSMFSKNILSKDRNFVEINQQLKINKINDDKKIINIILYDSNFFIPTPIRDIILEGNPEEITFKGIGIPDPDYELENAQIYGLAKLKYEIPKIESFIESDKMLLRKYKKDAGEDITFISRYNIYYNQYIKDINLKLKNKEVNWYILQLSSGEFGEDIRETVKRLGGDGKVEIYGYDQ